MNKSIQTRLDRLVTARQEQDAERVKVTISVFLEGMTPDQLWACRQSPDLCRERLWGFLADQPPTVINIIERWAARKGGK